MMVSVVYLCRFGVVFRWFQYIFVRLNSESDMMTITAQETTALSHRKMTQPVAVDKRFSDDGKDNCERAVRTRSRNKVDPGTTTNMSQTHRDVRVSVVVSSSCSTTQRIGKVRSDSGAVNTRTVNIIMKLFCRF